jgi:hypothetical protein
MKYLYNNFTTITYQELTLMLLIMNILDVQEVIKKRIEFRGQFIPCKN